MYKFEAVHCCLARFLHRETVQLLERSLDIVVHSEKLLSIFLQPPLFDLLRCDAKGDDHLREGLRKYLRQFRTAQELSELLEANEEVSDVVKEVVQRIEAGADILGRLNVHVSSAPGDSPVIKEAYF